jgi:hypothetical protein
MFCVKYLGSSLSGVESLILESLREVKPQNVQDLVECPTLAVCLLVIAAHCVET